MHVESFVVCILGTRCRDGVKVLWCRSHLVWLVFEGSIPTLTLFVWLHAQVRPSAVHIVHTTQN